MRTAAIICVAVWALGACNATNTGNPNQDPAAPAGIELVRSKLVREADPQLLPDDAKRFATDSRDFAFSLYRELRGPKENLFYSPYSISTALGMTYGGARGETKTEMATALHFGLPEPALHRAFNATDLALARRANELSKDSLNPAAGDGFQLDLVNGAFLNENIRFMTDYVDLLGVNYGAGIFLADFDGAREKQRLAINDWVSQRTHDRIDDLLPTDAFEGVDRVAFVLVNAIYFKASWLEPFDPARTAAETFHAPAGDRKVQMMQRDTALRYMSGDGYAALSLPYISQDVRMLFILPDEARFDEVDGALDRAHFDQITSKLSEYDVKLKVPRFSFEFEVKLKDTMMALGMKRAFESTADFSGIASEGIWLDAIYHKAFVALDERGTEAAASTAVVGVAESAKPQADFYLDRPFIFLIYDAPTGQILFVGRLLDPG